MPGFAKLNELIHTAQIERVEMSEAAGYDVTEMSPAECYAALKDTRSGARSMQAARVMAAELSASGGRGECVNVAEGFEGDLGPERHRGTIGGWKAAGLPWKQN